MTQVYVKYNPYRLKTELKMNGKELPQDSGLYKLTKGKRLQEWIGAFPADLRRELSTVEFSIEFCGMQLDWDDFEDAFDQARKAGTIDKAELKYTEVQTDEDINEKVVHVFNDLKNGPIEEFRSKRMIRAFETINDAKFPVNVIATMSSGKSTLINALLAQKLMPSKNAACTATITEILDVDRLGFTAVACDENDEELERIPELTYEIMERLNADESVEHIYAEGNIPFLDARDTALKLVDTPGPNNAQNQAHKNTTYRAINNDSNNLILYVLNGTQLSTNDDASLLRYVAEQIQKGGKQMRDRFLFVVNKMDSFNPEEESIDDVISSVKRYLANYGIEDPQLFPCSAFMALNIRTYLADVDIDNLTRTEEKKLPVAARDTLSMIDKVNEFEAMHLERYTALSPSAQEQLNFRLHKAIEKGDTKEQALIHSGICSIEAAIAAYVKKYARTKKIKDLVESFQEELESSRILAHAKEQVATNEKTAEACSMRAAAIREKIEDGQEAAAFKEKIQLLDPMPAIKEKAHKLEQKAATDSTKVFSWYGDTISSREEAKRLVNQFSTLNSDALAELTAELESAINTEIVHAGETLLDEYQKKLEDFDESAATDVQLEFKTADLVKGTLQSMRETAASWTTDDFAAETVEDVGEVTYEERKYYEKVGEKKEEVVSGSHEEKIGTRKVKVGSHKEQVGTRKEKKRGFFAGIARLFGGGYEYVPVYETVDDYEEEDVFKTVLDYKTIVRDVFEERTEKVEKFSVKTSDLQTGLIAQMRRNLADGIGKALQYAEEMSENMKKQFSKLFDALDEEIKRKYAELEQYAEEATKQQQELEKNRKVLDWIETNIREINAILDF